VDISIVVPCYRSAATLPVLVSRTIETLEGERQAGRLDRYEIILVVDGGVDGTAEAASALADTELTVKTVLLRRNFGQHNALMAGIRTAANAVVVTMDDDLQHPPEEIPKLLAAMSDPAIDLVYAVPVEEEHGFWRSLASRTVKRSLALAGVANAPIVGAFRALRTDLREGFTEANDPQVNIDVVLSWTTTSVIPVSVNMNKRKEGRSSYSLSRLIAHTLNMVTGYGVVPLRIATWLGFICAAIGVALFVYVLVRYATGETTVQGFTTLAALISVFAGAQMLTIGIIGEYIGRQHFKSLKRPMYLVRSISR
jgi:undecaprenyl-phosphate 4-deoxy-4-formamido-L-arabinose transferase